MKYLLIVFLLFSITFVKADIVEGNLNGNVTLVEFYDYQCPHCGAMFPIIQQLIASHKNLRVVYRPIGVLTPLSKIEALAVIAANKQHKFKILNQALMTHVIKSPQDIFMLAGQLKIDVEQLKITMQSEVTQAVLNQNLQLFYSTKAQGIPLIMIGNAQGVIGMHQGAVSSQELNNEII